MLCSFPGCDNPKSPKAAKGLCNSHYWQLHKGRELTPLRYRRNRCEPWLEEHKDYAGDDCLIWPFARGTAHGYAQVKYKGKQQNACPVMCEMAHGPKPTPEHEAAHSCGKGHLGCINPRHLSWKTPKENAADKELHGTVSRGERQGVSKLKEKDVLFIRAMAGKAPQSALAAQFGVRQSTINKIVQRQRWRHI
jgi:hypothetical protein